MIEIYNRLKSKIHRTIVSRYVANTPLQQNMTYQYKDRNWYEPLIAGPNTFQRDLTSADTIEGVISVLKLLEPDEYIKFNLGFLRKGLSQFGNDWHCGDITTALYSISNKINVKNYLEIGVRRGRSMAMVAKLNPEVNITGFDMWIENYVGINNPGPDFVKKQLKKIGHKGTIELINGNSRKTVPNYFLKNPKTFFDLITVDGDHTKRGAKADLNNVIPRLKVGGFLVFDDIVNPWHTQLNKLWKNKIEKNKRFLTYSFRETGYGVGVAIKKW